MLSVVLPWKADGLLGMPTEVGCGLGREVSCNYMFSWNIKVAHLKRTSAHTVEYPI